MRNVIWMLSAGSAGVAIAAMVFVLTGERAAESGEPAQDHPPTAKAARGKTPSPVAGRLARRPSPRWQLPAPDGEAEHVDPPSEASPGELDPIARKATVFAAWEAELAEHRDATVDSSWAGEAEHEFSDELREMSDETFEVTAVDCRTESCLATLQFGSFAEASESVGDLLHRPYRNNCATKTIMPEPEEWAAPYSAEVLFMCG